MHLMCWLFQQQTPGSMVMAMDLTVLAEVMKSLPMLPLRQVEHMISLGKIIDVDVSLAQWIILDDDSVYLKQYPQISRQDCLYYLAHSICRSVPSQ